MDIRSMLSTTPPRESPSLESSSGYSASNPRPIAKNTSAVTPSINFHSTTAITEKPVLDLDTTAERTLPYDGFDDMYDDSRHNSPEANAGPGKGSSDLPPFQESNLRGEPLISSANSQLVATKPADPTSGASLPRTTVRAFSSAWNSTLPLPERNNPIAHQPIDEITPAPYSSINSHETTSINFRDEPQNPTPWPRTTSPVAFSRLEIAAISSNRIPNNATDTGTAQLDAAARSSSRTQDGAKIVDVDAWEAQRRIQVTHQPSDLSPQASSRTLSGSEQTVVDFLASNSRSRTISQGPSGSRTGSNAKYENDSPLYGPELENWLYIDIETAIRENFDDQLGAALLCMYASDCHKQDEIRKGKQKQRVAPLSSLFPSIENDSTTETESPNEDEANMDYIYNVRPHTLTSNGTEVRTIKAKAGSAVWSLVRTRLGPEDDSRRWETACQNCSTIIDSRMAQYCQSCTEQRERTISPQEAAVDDNRNQTEGVALALASGQTASSRSRSKAMRQANGNVKSNANGTQSRPSPPPLPPSRPSRRSRRPSASEPEVPPPAPAPAASSRRRSHCGRTFGRLSPSIPDQVQAFDKYETKEANNVDDEQGWRNGKKKKKNVSWDPKENGQTNSKREASNAVEDIGGGRVRARARRQKLSDSSNEANELGPSERSHRFAASGTSVAGRGTGFGAGTSSSGTNLTAPDPVAAHAPDPVTYSTSPATRSFPATPPAREGSSGTRVRLTLRVPAEANPVHPYHEEYLTRMEVRRRMGRE